MKRRAAKLACLFCKRVEIGSISDRYLALSAKQSDPSGVFLFGVVMREEFHSCYTVHMDSQQRQQDQEKPSEEVLEEVQPIADDTPGEDAQLLPQSPEATNEDEETLLRWESPEYVQHERPVVWYIIMAIVVAALMAVAIFWMNSISFALLIPVMVVALLVYVRRPPAVVRYTLSRKGLHVDDRLLPYDTFKSFGVIVQGGHNSIILTPRKRFQLAQVLYFPEDVGEPLVDMLAARLPMKEVKPDLYDRITSKLRI